MHVAIPTFVLVRFEGKKIVRVRYAPLELTITPTKNSGIRSAKLNTAI
jgi:hypothetical protein